MTQPRLMPMLATLLGIALFSLMDATMKRASLAGSVYDALLLRALIGSVLLLPVWRLNGGRWPQPRVLRVHVKRALVVTAMALLFFLALLRLPLAEAFAISFIAPLVALFLAAALLGERIARSAFTGSLLALAGVVVIAAAHLAHPATAGAHASQAWGIAAMLGSAVLYGWNLVLQRQQAQLAGPREVAFFQNLLVGSVLLLVAPLLAHHPSVREAGFCFAAAVLSAISLMLFSWSYARAEAQVLLPLEYTAFIWAALIGWLWFGEAVDSATLAGVVLIVAGCWAGTRGPGEIHTEQTAM